MMTGAMKLKDACSLEDSYDQPRQHIKKQKAANILIRIKTMYRLKKKVSLQIVSILIQEHGISLHLFNDCQ